MQLLNYLRAFLIISRHSLHLLVTYAQSPAATLSLGKSFEPIPTQNTPAANHFSRFSFSGATPPVTINFDQGIGALRPFTMLAP